MASRIFYVDFAKINSKFDADQCFLVECHMKDAPQICHKKRKAFIEFARNNPQKLTRIVGLRG